MAAERGIDAGFGGSVDLNLEVVDGIAEGFDAGEDMHLLDEQRANWAVERTNESSKTIFATLHNIDRCEVPSLVM